MGFLSWLRGCWDGRTGGPPQRNARIYVEGSPNRTTEPSVDLLYAVKNGEEAQVRKLLKEQPPLDTADEYGNTALHLAAATGQTPIVAMLLAQRGIRVNARNNAGQTPLHHAILSDPDLASFMLDHGAQPGIANHDGETVLFLAAAHMHRNFIRKALSHPKVNLASMSNEAWSQFTSSLHKGDDLGPLALAKRLARSGTAEFNQFLVQPDASPPASPRPPANSPTL